MTESTGRVSSGTGQSAEIRTFLIADVRGYTQFTVERGDAAAARLATRFAELCREAVAARDGEVIELRGDEALCVFPSTRQALWAAVELQARFAEASISDPALPIRVGIGLDAGEAIPVSGGFRGVALNRAARLCSIAAPGQILASDTIVSLAGRVEGLVYVEREERPLKGFAGAVRMVEVQPSTAGPELAGGDGERAAEPDSAEEGRTALPIGGFLGSLPANFLVAREAELRAALESVEAVAAGEGRTVLLAGEPGAGKTRLAQEITLNLRNLEFLIAAGRCYEAEQTVPYYPFLEALARVYEVAPREIQQEAGRRWPYLGALLPNHLGVPEVAGGPDEQQRVFFAVTAFLEAVARSAPIGLLMDDLHWADSASLKLFLHLAQRTRSSRLFLLGTYRDVEVGRQHPLEDTLRELSREGLSERIPVRRLDQDGTAALIAAQMGEKQVSVEFAGLVYSRTEGNPFFVQQVMHVLVERGDVFRQDGRWNRKEIEEIEVPESVRAVIGQRLSRLSEATQEFLHEAAVLGQTFSFDDIEAISRLGEEDLEAALDEAERAGLVRAVGRDVYGFDHALTQQSLYAELTSRRRRRLHQAAAEAIESLPERKREQRASELAWHFIEGDEPERALPYALQAGDQSLAVFAYAEAEWHFRMAAELAREFENRAAEARALQRLGDTLLSRGRYEEAIERQEEAASLYAGLGEADGELAAIASIGWAHHMRGSRSQAIARLEPLLERAPGGPSQGLCSFLVVLATSYYHEGRHEDALALTERAVAMAGELHDDRLRARALARHASVLSTMGKSDQSLVAFHEAIELSERVGDLGSLNISLNNLTLEYATRGESERLLPLSRRQVEVARRSGAPDDLAWALFALGASMFGRGDWHEARVHLAEAATICGVLGPTRSSVALAWYAALRLWSGEEKAKEELEALAGSDDAVLSEAASHNLARWDIPHDRAPAAAARLEPLLRHPDLEEQARPNILRWLGTAAMMQGDLARADDLLERASTMRLIPPVRAEVTSGVAGLRVAQGRQAEAAALLDEVQHHLERMGMRTIQALFLLEHGYIQARLGDPDRARSALGDSLALFQEIGASAAISRINELLQELA